jgi:hypothetical protein
LSLPPLLAQHFSLTSPNNLPVSLSMIARCWLSGSCPTSAAKPCRRPLVIAGFILGLLAWRQTGNWRWSIGAAVLIANWPYTLLGIFPTNHRIKAIEPANASATSRALIEKWGILHAGRTALGIVATVLFLWASIS